MGGQREVGQAKVNSHIDGGTCVHLLRARRRGLTTGVDRENPRKGALDSEELILVVVAGHQ